MQLLLLPFVASVVFCFLMEQVASFAPVAATWTAKPQQQLQGSTTAFNDRMVLRAATLGAVNASISIPSPVVAQDNNNNDAIAAAFHDDHVDEELLPQPREPHLWNKLSAPTLATIDMAASVHFYETLGLVVSFGGADSFFTTMQPPPITNPEQPASMYVNLFTCPDYPAGKSWGRLVIYCDDVDAMYQRAMDAGFEAEFEPDDAFWGERYFHILDPSGHELSFAQPIEHHPRWTGEPWQHLMANHVKRESLRGDDQKPSQCV
mmetsp:Transcript_3467/g.9586  ORF Transcript_3467/g.9586 Transcript_3467/m.9586 type:complete len:263 (+) Transcript_3467:157-945(+)|eukprot:CAMPEP_0168735140 /NCGR_PEP_ID=MMETSP0724-20121128/9177_1 /TAXON_ID=265536 /ORGANISM="Amphiprora sp., Strain CCMP467" /LENGTH=262 /DNA_ID=CAMNT_0008782269 /DNA_START=75 /DNA_END=863 /DNA_ORIENTATION=+